MSADTRPHVATHYQQRRFYAQSNANPEGIEASRTGFFNNFGRSSPVQDDDALTFRIAGRGNMVVRHMLGLKRLIVFTDGGVWPVGNELEPLTPSTLLADQQTYTGVAADVPPVVVGNSAIYVQGRGSIVFDLRFDQQVEGLNGRDLTLFASHLVDGYEIECMDYQETPHPIVWCCRDDGTLLGLTYIRDQNVWGWHRHDTDGDFEQVCVIPEAGEDYVYLVVSRVIGGVTKRYIEKIESRTIRPGFFNLDSFFVDSGLTYDGAPATVFAGLGHLEGERVAVLGDGDVVTDGTDAVVLTVTGGSVTIPVAKSRVHIGLPIQADLETLDLDVGGSAIRDKQKRVGSMYLVVDKSSRSFLAGPDSSNLTPHEISSIDEAPTEDEHTGLVEMTLKTGFTLPGRIFVRQNDPLPLTVLGIVPNLIVGG